jgi:hypothetical protein
MQAPLLRILVDDRDTPVGFSGFQCRGIDLVRRGFEDALKGARCQNGGGE